VLIRVKWQCGRLLFTVTDLVIIYRFTHSKKALKTSSIGKLFSGHGISLDQKEVNRERALEDKGLTEYERKYLLLFINSEDVSYVHCSPRLNLFDQI